MVYNILYGTPDATTTLSINSQRYGCTNWACTAIRLKFVPTG